MLPPPPSKIIGGLRPRPRHLLFLRLCCHGVAYRQLIRTKLSHRRKIDLNPKLSFERIICTPKLPFGDSDCVGMMVDRKKLDIGMFSLIWNTHTHKNNSFKSLHELLLVLSHLNMFIQGNFGSRPLV